jgi:transposase
MRPGSGSGLSRDGPAAPSRPSPSTPHNSPWRLALVTMLQGRADLSDGPAAEAVRARIDGKSLLGLELTDPGFDASVLSEFRARLLAGAAAGRLLEQWLGRCKQPGLLKGRGRQRRDATHVRASVRTRNRLEWLAETVKLSAIWRGSFEAIWRHSPAIGQGGIVSPTYVPRGVTPRGGHRLRLFQPAKPGADRTSPGRSPTWRRYPRSCWPGPDAATGPGPASSRPATAADLPGVPEPVRPGGPPGSARGSGRPSRRHDVGRSDRFGGQTWRNDPLIFLRR